MRVLRIVSDLEVSDPQALAGFYERLFGLKIVMDAGFIVTLQGDAPAPIQISLASEGGSGTPVPALSIEVDDLDDVIARLAAMGVTPSYGPVDEPWGVRRLYVRDPAGTLLNILCHAPAGAPT
ncbi:MAG: glyoxalase [Rhodobacteraceae bacterium]|nr:glyoxalase [Paracoccaceae bacterium]